MGNGENERMNNWCLQHCFRVSIALVRKDTQGLVTPNKRNGKVPIKKGIYGFNQIDYQRKTFLGWLIGNENEYESKNSPDI